MSDVECQVCHHLDFKGSDRCEKCRWPLKPITLDEPVFGFEVAIQVRTGMCDSEIIEKHFQTSQENVARRRAKNTPRFIRILAIRPLAQRQFVGAYGDRNIRST